MQDITSPKVRFYDTDRIKMLKSPEYNYVFMKDSGLFVRWGKTKQDDPQFSPYGPEILDLEITVNGCPNACTFCYKGNRPTKPTNMAFETFKQILDKVPKTLTQIAFGITGVRSNPDFLKMMKYCRECGVIPNFTLSGIDLDDDFVKESSKLIGAVAVSAYESDKNVCYNTVKKYLDAGIKQTNIHLLVSDKTLDFVWEVLKDRQNDPRLKDMNAIVFLGVKPKGRASTGKFQSVPQREYEKIIKYCLENKIPFGFDSCSAPKFEATIRSMDLDKSIKEKLISYSESCESSLFSSYINVHGEYWHCSFSENECDWKAIDVLKVSNFLEDVWNNEEVKKFRNKCISTEKDGCRDCITFPEIN